MSSRPRLAFIVGCLLFSTGSVQALADSSVKPATVVKPTTGGYSVSSSWMGDKSTSRHEIGATSSAGRRLAVALPMLPSSAAARLPFIQPARAQKPQIIHITVPANVGQAIDSCSQSAKKLTTVGLEKANQVASWLALLFKQINHSSPMMTPLGGPYAFQSAAPVVRSKFQLWYMGDGRLKTVVSR